MTHTYKHIAGAALATTLFFVSPLPAAASGLSVPQVSAILSVLQTFGVDAAVVRNIQVILSGGQPQTTPGRTEPQPTQTPAANRLTVARGNLVSSLVSKNNIYSPDVIMQGGTRYMYFGGWWDAGQTNDKIYRAECVPSGICGNVRLVLDPASIGVIHLNDPTLVTVGDHYVMYMTVAPNLASAFDYTQAAIYYATSPVHDGLSWSNPVPLLPGYVLPSATKEANGHIALYANSSVWGGVEKVDLGLDGVSPTIPGVRTVMAGGGFYCNVNVQYRPTLGAYQMFGERGCDGTPNGIDFLTSRDGVSWDVLVPDLFTPQSTGFAYVRAPAADPDTGNWVYFSVSNDTVHDFGNSIVFQTWSAQQSLGNGGTQTAAAIQSLLGRPTTSMIAPAPAAVFTRTLKRGMEGADVASLQTVLIQRGFLRADVTGYFGPQTETALRSYQQANRIPIEGVVGPLTKAALNAGQ